MTQTLLRPLGVGEIIDGAFMLYRRHFTVLLLTAFVVFLPSGLLSTQVVIGGGGFDVEVAGPRAWLNILVVMVVGGLGYLLAMGALTHQLARAHSGDEVRLGAGLVRGLRTMIPLAFSIVLAYVVIFIAAIVPGVALTTAVAFFATFIGMGEAIGAVLSGFTMLVSVIAVLVFVAASLFALVPVMVVEGLGPWRAIRRSWQLSRGGRMRILAVLGVAWIITLLPSLGLLALTGASASMWSANPIEELSAFQLFLNTSVSSVVNAFTAPCMTACLVVLYFDRRVRLEGYDLEAAVEAIAVVE